VEELIPRLNNKLPPGLRILSGTEISLKNPAISDSLDEICYSISGNGHSFFQKYPCEDLESTIRAFLARKSFPAQKHRKGKKTTVDIRPMLKDLSLGEGKTVEVTLQFPSAGSIRLGEIFGAIWGISEAAFRTLRIVKTKVKLKQTWDQNSSST
jgi:radical SAM-linked protein